MNKQEMKGILDRLGDLYESVPKSNNLKENGLKDSILEAYQRAHSMYCSVVADEMNFDLKALSAKMPFQGEANINHKAIVNV